MNIAEIMEKYLGDAKVDHMGIRHVPGVRGGSLEHYEKSNGQELKNVSPLKANIVNTKGMNNKNGRWLKKLGKASPDVLEKNFNGKSWVEQNNEVAKKREQRKSSFEAKVLPKTISNMKKAYDTMHYAFSDIESNGLRAEAEKAAEAIYRCIKVAEQRLKMAQG